VYNEMRVVLSPRIEKMVKKRRNEWLSLSRGSSCEHSSPSRIVDPRQKGLVLVSQDELDPNILVSDTNSFSNAIDSLQSSRISSSRLPEQVKVSSIFSSKIEMALASPKGEQQQEKKTVKRTLVMKK
jgi:hypothetical protein